MRKQVIAFGVATVAALALFLPANRPATLIEGVDLYDTHRLLFGSRTFSQEITSKRPITGIGLLLVDIRRSNNVTPVQVTLRDKDGTTLAAGTIDPNTIADDSFATVLFDSAIILPAGGAIIDVENPDATDENALGWRFDPETTHLQRFENGVLQTGGFAVQLQQRVLLWEKIQAFLSTHKKEATQVSAFLLGILIFTVLAVRLHNPETHRRAQFIVIGIIAVAAFFTRMHVQTGLGGVSGGDPYNYLFIAESITSGENPFIGAKRLPGYPLLLTPAIIWPSIDAHVYMRTVSALVSTGSIITIFFLARALGFTWPAQLFAAVSLAWQTDFFATSLRPEPYSLFGFLLLLCLLLFFTAKSRNAWILFGVLLGYSSIVRQEGFVLALILGLAAVLREVYIAHANSKSLHYKKLAWMFAPALLLVLPFFLSNTVQFGNPLYTPYFEGEKLQIVDSMQAFKDASLSTWGILTSMWKPSWVQQEILMPYDNVIIPITFLLGIAWWVVVIHKKEYGADPRIRWAFTSLAIAFIAWSTWLLIFDIKDAARYAPMFVAGLLLTVLPLFFVRTGWRGVLISVVLVSQLLIATWFHPFSKHYQQSIPLIMLLFAGTLFDIQLPKKRSITDYPLFAIWLIPFGLSLVILYSNVQVFADAHNASAALDSVLYRSARSARVLPGPYLYTVTNLPAELYHSLENIRATDIESLTIPDEVQTAVITGTSEDFPKEIEGWHKVDEFKSEGKDEVLYISEVWTR